MSPSAMTPSVTACCQAISDSDSPEPQAPARNGSTPDDARRRLGPGCRGCPPVASPTAISAIPDDRHPSPPATTPKRGWPSADDPVRDYAGGTRESCPGGGSDPAPPPHSGPLSPVGPLLRSRLGDADAPVQLGPPLQADRVGPLSPRIGHDEDGQRGDAPRAPSTMTTPGTTSPAASQRQPGT